jgi:hypothetical protein
MDKAVMQVAVEDGRKDLGGLITLRLPQNPWSACLGCYLEKDPEFPRGEGLLTTTTSAMAALASNMAVVLFSRVRTDFLRSHNLFFLNLDRYEFSALAVERRKECRICGSV